MKLRSRFYFSISLLVISLIAVSPHASAISLTVTNAPEYAAITSGEIDINKATSEQISHAAATATEQSVIDLMNTQIMNWQNKRNLYLKSAKYGEAIANACSLFADGVNTLRSLYDISISIQVNPQGTICSGIMSNLYMETAYDFINVYSILKQAVKAGGENNMLDGSKRLRLLWQATDMLEELNKKLHMLSYMILVTSYEDVWNAATAGMIEKTHTQLASEAFRRWKRAVNNVAKFEERRNSRRRISI